MRSIIPLSVPLPTRSTTITTDPTVYTTTPQGKEIRNLNAWTLIAAIGGVVGAGFLTYYVLNRRPAKHSSASSSHPTSSSSTSTTKLSTPSSAKLTPVPTTSSSSFTAASSQSSVSLSPAVNVVVSPSPGSGGRPTHPPASAVTSSGRVVSDTELLGLLHTSLTSIAQAHNDESLEAQIRSSLLPLAGLLSRPLPVRCLVAQWLLAVSIHHITNAQAEDEFDRHMRQQLQDMAIAWRLLGDPSLPGEDDDLGEDGPRGLDVLRIQVSQNLKDASLIIPVYERMMARKGDRSDEEVIVLFTIAPLLGRWKDVRTLGAEVRSRLGSLEQFHEAPMDYSVLYDLAVDSSKAPPAPLPTPPLSSLQWTQYRILAQRIRLRDVQCADADAVAQLREEFAGSEEDEWKNVNLQEAARVLRCGAVVQANSFSTVPMTLVGPGDGQRIECKGYADLQAECIVRQWEGYKLRCEDEELMETVDLAEEEGGLPGKARTTRVKAGVDREWRGTYTMTQEKADEEGPGHFARIHVVFDLELTLRSLPPAP